MDSESLGAIGSSLRQLWGHLEDIKFGSGLRFWLGVSGTTMMALLLLYPLRKRLSARPWFGRISSWFSIHLVLGFLGPVLILYHTNFGHGGFNANIALWSMLTIMASGVIGQFIYAEISARRHADKERAETHLNAIRSMLNAFAATIPDLAAVIHELDTFNSTHLQAPKPLWQSLRTRIAIRSQRKRLTQLVLNTFNQASQARQITTSIQSQLRANLQNNVYAYFTLVQRAANRGVREQLWARWRLFHLPLFLIMAAAVILHIIAVWGMDQDATQVLNSAPISASKTSSRTENTLNIIQIKRSTIPITSQEANKNARTTSPANLTEVQPTNTRKDHPHPDGTQTAFKERTTRPEPRLLSAPQRVTPAAIPKFEPKPQVLAQPFPTPARAPDPQKPAPPAAQEQSPAVAELQRRIDESPPMGLGGAKPRTLVEQIALFKSKQKASQFSHSTAETNFALTGKHTKVECNACHTKPLRETAQSAPRQCIACHKKDDVHRGRRNDCANCHTTNRWSEIIRRR